MSEDVRTQDLPPQSEFRFELEPGERLSVRLVAGSGDADVFGAEIIPGTTSERWHTFGDEAKACISTVQGCTLELIGSASTEYVADESIPPFQKTYANLHLYLEAKRIQARDMLARDLSKEKSKSVIRTLGESSLVLNNDNVLPPSEEGNVGENQLFNSLGQGPRVMILGPESAGKSTLVKFLANSALKSPAVCNPAGDKTDKGDEKPDKPGSEATGWWPTIVSIDPSVGTAPLPGTVSILPLTPIPHAALPSPSPAYPYGTTTLTTGAFPPTSMTVQASNTYSLWIGRDNARENEKHTKRVVEWLALALEKRLARDCRARCSGVLIDTPGVVAGDAKGRYSFLQHCIKTLKVDTIVILGHEKLNIEMTKLFGGENSGISIVRLPKSGGVVELESTFKQRLRSLQVRSYFYGGSRQSAAKNAPEDGDTQGVEQPLGKQDSIVAIAPSHKEALGGVPLLNPYSTVIPFDLLEVYSVGQENMAPSSALPIGASPVVTSTQLVKLDPANSTLDQSHLLNSVLALVQPPRGGGGPGVPDSKVNPPPSDDEILGAPILGFVYVTDIDLVRKKITVLSPSQGRLPSKTAIIGVSNINNVIYGLTKATKDARLARLMILS